MTTTTLLGMAGPDLHDGAEPHRRVFDLPFPREFSPDKAAAREHHHAWLHEMGLFTTEAAYQWAEACDVAHIVAGFMPAARGPRLNAITDWNGLALTIDDQFDAGPLGENPEQTIQVLQGLIDCFYTPPDQLDHIVKSPIQRATVELLQRLRTLMSPAWCARYAQHHAEFYGGVLREALTRSRPRPPTTLDEFIQERRDTVAMIIEVDLVQVAVQYEVPETIWALPQIQVMITAVNDCNALHNDIYTSFKDDHRGGDTFMTVLRAHYRCGPEEAIVHARKINDDGIAAFLRAKAELPDILDRLSLADSDLKGVDRFVIGLEHLIRGVHDLHFECARYNPQRNLLAKQAVGYIDDMHLADLHPSGRILSGARQGGDGP